MFIQSIHKIYNKISEIPFQWKWYGFLIFIFIYRLSFIGQGASSTGDEFRYWHAFHGFFDLAHGNLKEAINYFYTLGGRPILPIAYLPQFIVQSILYFGFDIDPRSSLSLTYVQFLSSIYSILLLILFFKILIKLFQVERNTALFFTILLASLVDNNVYVRHLYTYDLTLSLWFLLWLYFDKTKNYLHSGILIILITLIYPAYWPFALLSICLFLYGEHQSSYKINKLINPHLKLLTGGILGIAFIALIGCYSGHSILEKTLEAGQAYLYDLFIPFDGSLSLLINYYYQLDGIFGILILLLAFLGGILITRNFIIDKKINNFLIVAIIILICLLFAEIYGRHIGQKMLYARMCKQYSPLLIIMCYYYYKIVLLSYQKIFYYTTSILIVFNLISFHKDFYSLCYPRDILSITYDSNSEGFEHDILSSGIDTSFIRYNEYQTNVHYTVPPQSSNKLLIPDSAIFVNFSYPSQVRLNWNNAYDTTGMNCLFSRPHFFSYKIYSMDCDRQSAINKKRKDIKLSIYSK